MKRDISHLLDVYEGKYGPKETSELVKRLKKGWQPTSEHIDKAEVKKIKRLTKKGLTCSQIASELKVSYSLVYYHLRKIKTPLAATNS